MMQIDGIEISPKALREQWAIALMTKGVIVKLTIHQWNAQSSLKPEDLGIRFSDVDVRKFMKKYVYFGNERLLPPEVMKEISSIYRAGHLNLRSHSFDTLWGHFVPNTAFAQWHKENEIIRSDYIKSAKRLIERYDDIVTIIRRDYAIMARDVWNRLYPGDKGGATAAFIENFVSNIVAKIPPPDQLIERFSYEVTYFTVPLPSFIEEDITKAETIQIERQEQKATKHLEAHLERETRKIIEKEYRERKMEMIDSFLSATVSSIRAHLSELCNDLIQSIARSPKGIRKSHVRRINKMIKDVNLLNFHNDEEITAILGELKREVIKFDGDRNDDYVIGRLTKLVEVAQEEFIPDEFSPFVEDIEAVAL